MLTHRQAYGFPHFIIMTLFELSEAQNNLTTQANDSIDLNKMLENLFQDQTQCL